MTNPNSAAQAAEPQTVLSFDERERILCQFMSEPINHDQEMAIAIESAVLSKLRAPVADEQALQAWADHFPEISDMARLRDAWNKARASAPVADNWRQYALPGETTAEQVCERMNAEVTRRTVAAMRASAPVAGTPSVDALMAKWDDDGAARGPAFIELRDLARDLERKISAPVADERAAVDPCGYVAVKVSAVDWLKDKFPLLTIKAGLCERIAGRLYTITRLMSDHDAALASASVAGEAQQPAKITFVNGDPASCGCTIRFSDGGGEYSDVHYVSLCGTHSGAHLLSKVIKTGELTRPQHEDLEGAICAALDPASSQATNAAPQASEAVRIPFPAHLRRMWAGGEVQAWLDEHQGITPPPTTTKGSLQRYRIWRAGQPATFCSCIAGDGSLRWPCAVHGKGAGDVALPPLPPIHHKWAPVISDSMAEALQAWCRTFARAAVLADRQQRAEDPGKGQP